MNSSDIIVIIFFICIIFFLGYLFLRSRYTPQRLGGVGSQINQGLEWSEDLGSRNNESDLLAGSTIVCGLKTINLTDLAADYTRELEVHLTLPSPESGNQPHISVKYTDTSASAANLRVMTPGDSFNKILEGIDEGVNLVYELKQKVISELLAVLIECLVWAGDIVPAIRLSYHNDITKLYDALTAAQPQYEQRPSGPVPESQWSVSRRRQDREQTSVASFKPLAVSRNPQQYFLGLNSKGPTVFPNIQEWVRDTGSNKTKYIMNVDKDFTPKEFIDFLIRKRTENFGDRNTHTNRDIELWVELEEVPKSGERTDRVKRMQEKYTLSSKDDHRLSEYFIELDSRKFKNKPGQHNILVVISPPSKHHKDDTRLQGVIDDVEWLIIDVPENIKNEMIYLINFDQVTMDRRKDGVLVVQIPSDIKELWNFNYTGGNRHLALPDRGRYPPHVGLINNKVKMEGIALATDKEYERWNSNMDTPIDLTQDVPDYNDINFGLEEPLTKKVPRASSLVKGDLVYVYLHPQDKRYDSKKMYKVRLEKKKETGSDVTWSFTNIRNGERNSVPLKQIVNTFEKYHKLWLCEKCKIFVPISRKCPICK